MAHHHELMKMKQMRLVAVELTFCVQSSRDTEFFFKWKKLIPFP